MESTIAAYVRVSSRSQNTVSQEDEIRAWLKRHGHDLRQVRWYVDKASGKSLKRPEFDRLQRDIFDGRVHTVVCWKLDRISRRLREGINLLADWCDRGLKFVAVTQQIELTGTLGRMIAAVMLGLAEIELEYRADRQAAGIRAAKRRGVYNGRKTATTVGKPSRAMELRERGLKDHEIAAAMGITVRTVQRYHRRAESAA